MMDRGWLELLRRERGVGAVLSVVSVQCVAEGALDVLEVVLAINVLALGAGAAGYLGAAFGAGGVIGGVVALALVGRHRLVEVVVGAALAWGAAFIVIGVWPTVAGSFILLCACGVSRSVLGAASRTMLHRVVPAPLHGRVFGMLEGVTMLGLAIGAISVPVLVSLGGAEAAWIGVGSLVVIVSSGTLSTVRRLDRITPTLAAELALVRGHFLFHLLAAPVIEDLARALVPVTVAAGEDVVREGEWGGHFYLVGAGSLEVSAGGQRIRGLNPGDGFGEIALLRDGRRTATVTALEPTDLYELDREPFLAALTGSHNVRQAADALVLERLEGDRARTVS
jgi:CRP-like cAMP-binding protein